MQEVIVTTEWVTFAHGCLLGFSSRKCTDFLAVLSLASRKRNIDRACHLDILFSHSLHCV